MVPADMLLLAGSCIAEEAVLTGESTPVWKTPIGAVSDDGGEAAAKSEVDPMARLNINRDKNHVLFGGYQDIAAHAGQGC